MTSDHKQNIGVSYETADGSRIDNKKENAFEAHTENGAISEITAQVCDVNNAELVHKQSSTSAQLFHCQFTLVHKQCTTRPVHNQCTTIAQLLSWLTPLKRT